MLEVIRYYARCNEAVNGDLLRVLADRVPDGYELESTGYYRSVKDILFHIIDVDISWTHDLRSLVESGVFLDRLFSDVTDTPGENPYGTFEQFAADRRRLDELLVRFAADLRESDLEKELRYTGRDGRDRCRRVWKVLLHMYNHQTHHRGQISQILDQQKIQNDFSNLIRLDL